MNIATLLLLMAVDAALGFVAYINRDKLTGHMPEDWQDISDFTLGTMFYSPLPITAIFKILSDGRDGPNALLIPNIILRLWVALFLHWIPFIGGAIMGFRFFPSERYKKNGG
jgi:hypothetical protein